MKFASKLIQYDPSGIFVDQRGLSTDDVAALASRLARVRCEIVQQDPASLGAGSLLSATCSLDAACLELPERMLDDYVDRREASQLGRILATARRLREVVDRVVVLGASGSCRAGQALLEACCEPYFNELSRSQRGGRPRTYFVDQHLDNDAAGGLLELLTAGRSPLRLEDRWAILPIGTRDTLHTAIALRQLLSALRQFLGADADRLAELVVPVIGDSGRLFEIVQTIGCRDGYQVSAAVGESCSVFTAAGLLPAALVGMDVVRLLEGASAISDHFRTAPLGANAVLDFAGIGFLMEHRRHATIRVLQVYSKSLEAVGWWYEQLLCETAGESGRGVTPITAVSPRDLLPRGHLSLPGSSETLLTRVVADRWRCDALRVEPSGGERDPLNDVADKTLPELMAAAVQAAAGADRAAGRPAAEIRLPRIDEYALGQLLQMLMLATLVEQRLRKINTRSPHGEPHDDS